jgi:hypothetical protein
MSKQPRKRMPLPKPYNYLEYAALALIYFLAIAFFLKVVFL